MTNSGEAKRAARVMARLARGRAAASTASVGEIIRDRVLGVVPIPFDAVVAGYWPTGTELDIRPLLTRLHETGRTCALPVVLERDQPLLFRAWTPDTVLEAGPFNIPQPSAAAAQVQPTVLLVPLLSFDRAGHRLGYGAGFYDRTIQGLRAAGPLLTVGIGFAAQEMPAVPCDGHDEPLNWVITENYAHKVGASEPV